MRVAIAAWLGLAACGPRPSDPTTVNDLRLSDADGDGTGGDGAATTAQAIAAAIEVETEALAQADADISVAEDKLDGGGEAAIDRLVTLRADRVARRSFVAHLQACAAELQPCPPTLVEPALPAAWDPTTQTISGKPTAGGDTFADAVPTIAANACACRTRECAEWTLADLVRWEDTLPLVEQDDETAAGWVTMARECAYSRLGR